MNSAARTARSGLGDKPAIAGATAMRSGRAGGKKAERIFVSRRRLRGHSRDKDARTQALRPRQDKERRLAAPTLYSYYIPAWFSEK